jgi:Mg-chelatase subunit ChlD
MAAIIDNSSDSTKQLPVAFPMRNNSCMFPKKEPIFQKPEIQFTKNNEMTTNDIIIFLDESGSMETLGDEPKQACTGFIQTQYDNAMSEQNPDVQNKLLNVRIRLIAFSENYTTVLDAPVRDLNNTSFKYKPNGMTDLYSPLYDVFSANNNAPKDMVIISDGQNNSGPHEATYIKRQIKNAIDAGWTLKFVGCTVESMTESAKLGVQQYTSDCSEECEGASAPTMTAIMRSHSKKVAVLNRTRTGAKPCYEDDEDA